MAVGPDGRPLLRRRGRPPKVARTELEEQTLHTDINDAEVQSRLRMLIRLAREQEYLTWDDINDTLPAGFVTPELMDEVISRLRAMEIKILDDSEVEASSRREGQRVRDAESARLTPSMIRCACIRARWARCRCSRATRKFKFRSASKRRTIRCASACTVSALSRRAISTTHVNWPRERSVLTSW